jgi:hypothetical protein
MPLSSDPAKRAKQLANLKPGAGRGSRAGALARATSHSYYAQLAEAELDAEVLKVYDALGRDVPVRGPDGGPPAEDGVVLRQLAEALVRLRKIGDHLLARGIQREDGSLRPAAELDLRIRAHILELCRELGMTPKSRAALGVDLVKVASAGDRLQEHLDSRYGGDAAGPVIDAVHGEASAEDADGTGASG